MTDRFEVLSPQKRECVRLAARRLTSKEIARELGISKSTVDGYLAEAVQQVGARDRRDLVRLFLDGEPPSEVRGDPARVVQTLQTQAVAAEPEQPIDWRSLLPIRRKGARRNDLRPGLRLAWILILAIAMLIAFGQLATGLKVLGDLFAASR